MDWKQMQQRWQDAPAEPLESDLLGPIKQRDQSLRAKVRRRDGLESLVALLMAPVFAYMAWRAGIAEQWLKCFFAGLLAAWAVYVPLHLWLTRRALPTLQPEQPLIKFLQQSHSAMVLQAQQLERAWIWYLGPCAVGVIGMSFAADGASIGAWIYAAIVIGFFAFLARLNTRAARTEFRDHADDIQRHISLLTEESSQ
jgi:hypothetical protein